MTRPVHIVLIGCVAAAMLAGCNDSPTSPSSASPTFDLTLSPAAVQAGATTQGVVTLRSRTAHEFLVQLASSDAVASVPASVVVPAGSATAAFTVTTRLVAADTVTKITATAGATTQNASLQVLSPVVTVVPTLGALLLDAAVVRGGQSVQGTVRLTAAAPPGGVTVRLSSSNSAALVQATATIAAGVVSSTFIVSTRPVDLETRLEITAAYLDQSKAAPLRVTP